ncbi:Smr/MutS family protein [Acidisoma cladoniae]|uniref:Smr/MutS family protein n=1 Tax=Acidisoma cladoniae TaxID=3040935 RepID=UPI002550E8E9|nr:Smr/MutS family protein [Acidisoma sp. PAMC 29798]
MALRSLDRLRAAPKARRLSDRERAEWLIFAQAFGAKPLHEMAAAAPPEPPKPPAAPVAPPRPTTVAPPAKLPTKADAKTRPPPFIEVGGPAAGLDGGSWSRLRKGRTRPERILDLHGATAQSAFAAFERFIGTARADGIRCVEIVTGRGAGEGGVLRRELPHWINLPHLRGAILAATYPHRANTGAVVLLLRRVR